MEIPQETSSNELSAKRRFWKRAIRVSIVLCIVPLIYGLAGTVIGMLGDFSDRSTSGGADPEILVDDIATAASTTRTGLCFSALGLACLIFSVVKFNRLSGLPKHSDPAIDRLER